MGRVRMLISLLLVMEGMCAGELFAQPYQEAKYYDAHNEALDMFYEPLSEHGSWIVHEEYGLVWRPSSFYIHTDWRPYTTGYWVYSDYGWTWVSDEPWGWATYHYGRWFYDNRFGWLWWPDAVWGPAWVVWRYGGSRIGWAPMPPKIIWTADLGLEFSYIDIDELIPYEHFCFVEVVNFVRVDVVKFIVFPRDRHDFIVRDTRVALDYRRRGDKIVNNLPIQERVEQAVQGPIKEARVVETSSLDNQGLKGGDVLVFRPKERRGESPVPQAQAPVGIERRGPSVIQQPQAPVNIERRGPNRGRRADVERITRIPLEVPPAIIERTERRGPPQRREEAAPVVIERRGPSRQEEASPVVIERRVPSRAISTSGPDGPSREIKREEMIGQQIPQESQGSGSGSQGIISQEMRREGEFGPGTVSQSSTSGSGKEEKGQDLQLDRRRSQGRGRSRRDEEGFGGRRGPGPGEPIFRLQQGIVPPSYFRHPGLVPPQLR